MPPPPPVTPSPHRFIIKKENAPIRRTPLTQSHTPQPSTQHFNSTPRFNIPSTPRPAATQTKTARSPTVPRFTTPAVKKERDVIEDLSSDDLPYDVHQSIEHDDHDVKEEDRNEEIDTSTKACLDEEDVGLEPRPKRRRLSSSPMLLDEDDDNHKHEVLKEESLSSSIASLPSPHSKRPTSSHHYHKFLLTTPAPAPTPFPQLSPVHKPFKNPPRFLPPEPTEDAAEPLPDHFSPHRKGQRYVQGGMASQLRDWLTNISSSIPPNKSKDDPWLVRILVDEINGGGKTGMVMVKGRQIHDAGRVVELVGEVRCVLAGEGMGVGLQKARKVEVGSFVGIKGPVWEMSLEGMRWGVGVEWKALN